MMKVCYIFTPSEIDIRLCHFFSCDFYLIFYDETFEDVECGILNILVEKKYFDVELQ